MDSRRNSNTQTGMDFFFMQYIKDDFLKNVDTFGSPQKIQRNSMVTETCQNTFVHISQKTGNYTGFD